MILVDTSTLYAVLDRDDEHHAVAKATWGSLLQAGEILLVTNYIVVETAALVQHRLGMEAVRVLFGDILPAWSCTGSPRPTICTRRMRFSRNDRRRLSLVDCSSFHVMRSRMVRTVFAFDPNFREQGFDVLPAT